ncbi:MULTISPECIES: ChaN family lipoprotein [Ramlibacter]|uniref:ChaN family lipoprotein n=1 Tax=Ramlibacter aquaticus TaxID=2780094 RepID=A0ABR9SBN6_9BURK|nr:MULTISPECIES: ChaN family lipoprotein [Ramlibacter]MBE7939759.1 ChaN family lipoprotein [Ramlibacter aquaticus]
MKAVLLLWFATCLAGCAALAPQPDLLLLGEQHDAPSHQALHRQVVEDLAGRGQLAALALEMADDGHDTRGLPRNASEDQVRQALAWDEAGWPWAAYAPVVMAAVHAGVPVFGANLPMPRLAASMDQPAWDTRVPPAALEAQRQAVRDGHCGLLPESQVPRMARAQVARDAQMAGVLRRLAQPGRTVVLVTGQHHADTAVGIPLDLRDSGLRVESRIWPAQPPQKDYCAELKARMKH